MSTEISRCTSAPVSFGSANDKRWNASQRGHSLWQRLTRSQTRGDGASGLGDVVVLPFHLLWPYPTIVLVAPYHEFDRVVKHPLGHRLLRPMLDPEVVSGSRTTSSQGIQDA